MADPKYPPMNPNDAPGQPPMEMRQTRIVTLPETGRYVPEEADPSKVLIVSYDDYMTVVRELSGSQMAPFRAYGKKLEAAIRAGAYTEFLAAVDKAYRDGYDDGFSEGHSHFVPDENVVETPVIGPLELPEPPEAAKLRGDDSDPNVGFEGGTLPPADYYGGN